MINIWILKQKKVSVMLTQSYFLLVAVADRTAKTVRRAPKAI